ncbi:MAG: dipeptidase [Candidatus Latescibacteria bacterium]|nr:dipeptidase [Candidatus Latescibacterota bacterium]
MPSQTDSGVLHDNAIVVDTHNDTIVAHIRRGNLGLDGQPAAEGPPRTGTVAFLRGPMDRAVRAQEVQIDFPKMRAGGIDAAFFAVDVTLARNNYLAYALDAFGYFEVEAQRNDIVIARSADDVVSAKREGRLAAILAVENSDVVEGSLNVLRMLYRAGVRSIGLTHNISSWGADGNAEERSRGGLTSFGVKLVEEMNRLGMVVDIAHISTFGFRDVMETSQRPVICSHGNCKAVCDHPRNLDDDQIRALARNGGSMGITFVPRFVAAEEPTFDRLLDHIDHAVQVGGIDHVGIGSDFDGGGTLVDGAASFPRITEALVDRGYGGEDVRKIMGGNHMRVLREALGG